MAKSISSSGLPPSPWTPIPHAASQRHRHVRVCPAGFSRRWLSLAVLCGFSVLENPVVIAIVGIFKH